MVERRAFSSESDGITLTGPWGSIYPKLAGRANRDLLTVTTKRDGERLTPPIRSWEYRENADYRD